MKRFAFTVLFLGLLVTETISFSAGAIATPSSELSHQFLLESSTNCADGKAVGDTTPPPPGGST
ncbi:MAG: hypothetical protein WBA57_13695 [Elainellaceae cyanobacterium]